MFTRIPSATAGLRKLQQPFDQHPELRTKGCFTAVDPCQSTDSGSLDYPPTL